MDHIALGLAWLEYGLKWMWTGLHLKWTEMSLDWNKSGLVCVRTGLSLDWTGFGKSGVVGRGWGHTFTPSNPRVTQQPGHAVCFCSECHSSRQGAHHSRGNVWATLGRGAHSIGAATLLWSLTVGRDPWRVTSSECQGMPGCVSRHGNSQTAPWCARRELERRRTCVPQDGSHRLTASSCFVVISRCLLRITGVSRRL